jgi:hypothetical protein
MPRIFISYRRADSQSYADRLYAPLADAFAAENVFRDVNSIALAQDFRAAIERAIILSDVLLVLIGPGWVDMTGEDGRRRLDNPDDFVRLEIEMGLRHGLDVIPVLVDDARMPRSDQLPPSMYYLPYRNGATLRPDPDLNADIAALVTRISTTFAGAAEPAQPQPDPPDTIDDRDADDDERELARAPSPPPAENAPDWVNAMVPGLDIDYEATEDAPIEQYYIEPRVHADDRTARIDKPFSIMVNGHEIRFDNSVTGAESVYYDGELVSRQRTLNGGEHRFTVEEDGGPVDYVLTSRLRWHGLSFWLTLTRNGTEVFSNK